jgi:hypothetical protein
MPGIEEADPIAFGSIFSCDRYSFSSFSRIASVMTACVSGNGGWPSCGNISPTFMVSATMSSPHFSFVRHGSASQM